MAQNFDTGKFWVGKKFDKQKDEWNANVFILIIILIVMLTANTRRFINYMYH